MEKHEVGDLLLELGLILIGTGLIVLLAGRVMVRSTNKTVNDSRKYEDMLTGFQSDREETVTENDFKKLVKRTMKILYAVGATLIGLGILLLLINR